ncbi:hypothetical protein V5799_018033 [Amblyomma americanum]|uniref:IPT/TIG domain-containing protein n=1 Tax=Amblyomma americanum TaxID=6943 RepID=A0AAQ4F0K1_AMBAM
MLQVAQQVKARSFCFEDDLRVPCTFFLFLQVASLSGVLPKYGPIAGGTNITLRGVNLDIGSERVVTVGGRKCRIHKVYETLLECSTSAVAADQIHQEMQVTVAIDGVSIPYTSNDSLGTTFTYMPNPVIENISPRRANYGEKTTIEVSGFHLDSVYNPKMVVQVASLNNERDERITKACHVLDTGQKMVCPGPSLTDFSVISGAQIQAYGRMITALVSFQMDGLHLPLSIAGGEDYFTFAYRPAMLSDLFEEELLENKVATLTGVLPRYGPVAGGTNLTLFGRNLDMGSERVVRIGDSYCKISSFCSAFLDCTTSAVAAREARKGKRVMLFIDGVEVPFGSEGDYSSIFTYKPDPVIYDIKPPSGTFSGLSFIEVRGKHLDSASAPSMVTRLLPFNQEEEDHTGGVCRVAQNGRRMLCPIAPVVDSCVAGSARQEAPGLRVLVELSFQMDGLQLLANDAGDTGHFSCVHLPVPGFVGLPHEKPDGEKTTVDTNRLLLIAVALFLQLLLAITVFYCIWILYRRLRAQKMAKTSCEDRGLDHASSMDALCGRQKNGCTQMSEADERQVIIGSGFVLNEKFQPMFETKGPASFIGGTRRTPSPCRR